MFGLGRLRRTPQGLDGHPLYRLGLKVQRGKLTLEQAAERLDSTRELRDLADSQLADFDKQIGELIPTNRSFAFILASLNHAAARYKGFKRVQVDSALRLVELTYEGPSRIGLLREALTTSRKAGYRRGEKTALARLAQIYAQDGRYDEAIACYKEQVEGAKGGGYSAIDVESLLALADIYRAQEEPQVALETLERTVRVAGAAGQPTGQVEALTRAAEINFLQNQPAAAVEALERGLAIASASQERRMEAEAATILGDVLRDLGRIGEALNAYRRGLAISGEDPRAQMQVLAGLVPLCAEVGRWQETADYARQGLLLSGGGEPAQEVAWLLDLALALVELGRLREGIDAVQDALAIARRQDPGGRLEHDALGRLGTLLCETGDWEGAIATLNEALGLSRLLHDDAAGATWLTHLARCAWYAGDAQGAIGAYTEALEIVRAIDDRALEAHTLGSLGSLLRENGQPRRGLEYYQEALNLSKVTGNGREVVRYLTLLGRTYSDLHQPEDARNAYQEALALARRLDDKRGQVEAHRRFAAHLRGRRDREAAMAEIAAAATLVGSIDDPRLAAITLQELAAAQEELGRWEESAASYRRLLSNAERIDDLSGKVEAHLQLGRLLQFKKPDESQQHLHQALNLAQELNDPAYIGRIHELLPTGTESDRAPRPPALS